MRIAVLGAGAMGSWFGGLLALQGNAVQLLTTNSAHWEAINNHGLVLKNSTNEQRVSVVAHSPDNIQTPVDLVLLTTKTFQSTEAITSIQAAVTDNTHILSLQNGLGNAEAIAQFIPMARVWVGVSMMPVEKSAPGVVIGKGHGSSYFGNALNNDNTDMAKHIESVFQNAQIELHHDVNIHTRIWEKVAFNSGINALSALSHGRPRTIGTSPGAKELAHNIAKEVAMVANTRNIEINLEHVYNMITLACTKHSDHIPSMLQDLQAARRTEVDALNGAVARIADQSQVAAPLNSTLTTLIRLAEISHQTYR